VKAGSLFAIIWGYDARILLPCKSPSECLAGAFCCAHRNVWPGLRYSETPEERSIVWLVHGGFGSTPQPRPGLMKMIEDLAIRGMISFTKSLRRLLPLPLYSGGEGGGQCPMQKDQILA
jgi:hypothetical protein